MAVDGTGMGRVGRQYSTFLSGFVVRIANTRFFSAPLSWRGDARAPPIATTQDFSAVLGVPRGTPGESSPSACGCGDDHGHPLPAGWFGCTAAGRFRIRQDRSRQPVCGAEGTTSPLSRNCFAGQRMGWDVWGDAWLAMGWNRLVGGLCISLWVPPCPFPSSFFSSKGGYHLRASSGVLLMPSLPDDGMTVGRHQNSNHGNQSPI